MLRKLLLMLGPPALVGLSYWLTTAGPPRGLAASGGTSPVAASFEQPRTDVGDSVQAACEQRAAELGPLLSPACRLIVRPPYVLGGDLTAEELDRCHESVILPVARALSIGYFDRIPDEPVTVLMFSGEAGYREHAWRLDGRRPERYYGYYQKADRRIMLNLATGEGTLSHELTHALAHFDFPEMPEWFDEGLAALHEEAEFSDDGLRLVGRSNWRLNYLLHALRGDRLPSLESLVTQPVRRGEEAVDYAHARYFCLYLQERQLLIPYYRKLRTTADRDPTGLETLRALLHVGTLDELDHDFRRWVESLRP